MTPRKYIIFWLAVSFLFLGCCVTCARCLEVRCEDTDDAIECAIVQR